MDQLSGSSTSASEGPDAPTIADRVEWARAVLHADRTGRTLDERRAAEIAFDLIDRLEAMLEHTSDMITVVSADGTIRYSNRAAGLMTGHDESVNGDEALQFVHPDDLQAVGDAFLRCAATVGGEERIEFRLRYADGTWHVVDAFAKNCLDQPVAGVVVSMRDITARKAAEDALAAANAALQNFVAVASHELRTPVTVIKGFMAILMRGDEIPSEQRDEFLSAINRATGRLGDLVEDLLTLSRLDASGLPPSDAAVTDPRPVIVEVLDDLSAAPDCVLDLDNGGSVAVGRQDLGRMVRNLVENPQKYGRPPFEVQLRRSGSGVELRVRDHGSGVRADFVPRLFDRFSRADRRSNGPGSGLGLSIVRELACAYGGDAWYEPGPDGGAEFVVRLPAP